MGHSEITQSPGQRGHNGEKTIPLASTGNGIVGLGQGQISRQCLGVLDHGLHPTGHPHAPSHNSDQGHGHHHALDQVGGRSRQKAPQTCIGHNNHGAQDHRRQVIHPEQGTEQFAACCKSAGGIRYKKHHNHQSRQTGQHIFAITVPAAEELRDGNGINMMAVPANSSGH